MSKRIIILILFFSILSQLVIVDDLKANTAEQRLIEVEKQLQAVANQIKQYEGEKTSLEKAILSNDSALKQVNSELAQVQARLVKAEEALEEALAGYDQSLENLAAVQQNIIQEQTKLGKIKKTELNFNNEIGVGLTILASDLEDKILILEMGMRGLGQIENLSKFSEPDIAVITNIGTAHIGILGSKENITSAKCEITKHLNPNGVVIIPANQYFLEAVSYTHLTLPTIYSV